VKGRITSYGRIRRSAFFMLLALGAEALSMLWDHPLSFYFFAAAGGLFALLSAASFLLSWFAPQAKSWAPITSIEESKEAASG
jgi:hypothetical protein